MVALASPKEIRYSIPRKLEWDSLSPDEKHEIKEDFKQKNPEKTFYAPSLKTGKLPAYSWNYAPKSYTGYEDSRYGSAVLCNYLPEYDLYLAVIDLDSPKEDTDIPIDELLKICDKWITQTHTRKTPSGGYHIYFLSETKPELKQPSFNIDYQTNTGNLKGKYVVCNYRYATKIDDEIIDLNKYYKANKTIDIKNVRFEKEHYNQLKNSPNDILVVKSTDEILNQIITEIENKNLWTPPIKRKINLIEKYKKQEKQQKTKELISLLKNYVREGTRDELAKALSGYLYKKGYSLKSCTEIFNQIFHDDEELDHRLDFLERTFDKTKSEVAGIGALKQLISPKDIKKIKELVENEKKWTRKEIDSQIHDIDTRIQYYLDEGFGVSDKMIIESVEKENTLFFDHTTLNYYVKNGDNSIKLIDGLFVLNHVNSLFGHNEISKKQCYRALDFVTRFIEREPYSLEFTNGLLCIDNHSATYAFHDGLKCSNWIPKASFPFKWNPDADGGKIRKAVNSILKTDKKGFEDNINTFFKCVGHSCMGGIEKDIFSILTGTGGTGKSTILTMLKRIFNYSEVSIPEIIRNERFALTPAVGKDINIDDDLQSDLWKGIGKLNTFISGNGGSVEIKGENERLQLTPYNTPKIWGGSNAMPPVIGAGWERRLILILCDNVIPSEKVDDSFQMDIMNGIYDTDLEWLVYQSITKYLDFRGKPFIKAEDKEAMLEEHSFKSDPLKGAVEHIFRESESQDIEVKEVYREIKRWFRYAKEKGKIFDEHKRPSHKAMNSAMDRAGYYKMKKSTKIWDENKDDWKYSSKMVYEDIMFNKDWLKEHEEYEETKNFR